jgi:DNA adenine methylase
MYNLDMNGNSALPTFLKWAGGKRRILDSLQPLLPKTIGRYFEPFLGGGSMFFFIKKNYNPRYSCISDINADLVQVYTDVRDRPREMLSELTRLKKRDSEEFYYDVRGAFNAGKLKGIKRSAAFVYMNKTCYSGLYRVNSKNEFNVPYGRYKKAQIFQKEVILEASYLLQGVDIVHQDYRYTADNVRSGDFVYLDPCYDPIKKTSFVQYTPQRFSDNDRIQLGIYVREVQRQGANILLSNNDLPEVRALYSDLTVHEIRAPRSLGASVGADKEIVELAISNF